MAVIDSRSPGILQPLERADAAAPLDAVRFFVARITGLDIRMVRQAFLRRPGTQPGLDDSWAAVQMDSVRTLGTPQHSGRKGLIQQPETGDVFAVSHQVLSFAVSFYGPDAAVLADDFREGAQIGQNLSELKKDGLYLSGIDETVQRAPDFMLEQWIDRYIVNIRLSRKVVRRFGIRTLASAGPVELITEKGKN